MGNETRTVGIIGARGIGRHHANWWRLAGVKVSAIVGTSVGSVVETAGMLKELMGFDGEGYIDVSTMLNEEQPTFVDVCSPDPCHGSHVRAALTAGHHVLCEKPFLFDPAKTSAELLAEADELLAMAAAKDLLLGLCSQHFVTAASCLRLFREAKPGTSITHVEALLASPGRGRIVDPQTIWTDLGPHVLAGVQALAPQGELDQESIHVQFTENNARCEFCVRRAAAADLECRLHVFRTEGQPSHVRRFVLNDLTFDLEGARGADGIYYARIVMPEETHTEDDPLRQLIRSMAVCQPPLAGAAVRRNLEWLLAVLDRSR